MSAILKLLNEFPWLWAVCNKWETGAEKGSVPWTIVVFRPDNDAQFEDLFRYQRNDGTHDWWVHLESPDSEKVVEIEELDTFEVLRKGFGSMWHINELAIVVHGTHTAFVVCPRRGKRLVWMINRIQRKRLHPEIYA